MLIDDMHKIDLGCVTAYAMAQEQGYMGTEAQWVDRLITAVGENDLDYVTPEMFGAVGDGETDDSAAFQDAIDSATENGKAVRLIGSYAIQDVELKSHTIIIGSYKTAIYTTAGHAAFIYQKREKTSAPGTYTYTTERCIFDGFSIRGDGIGFKYVEKEDYCYLANSLFRNLAFYATLSVCIEANLILCRLDNCIFGYYGVPNPNGFSHVIIESSNYKRQSTYNLFFGCRFYGATDVSVKMEYSLMNYFVHCNIEQNNCTGPTIYGIGCFKLVFDKCWIEENSGGTIIYQTSSDIYPAHSIVLRDCFALTQTKDYDFLVRCGNGKEYIEGCVIYANHKPINSVDKIFGSFYNNQVYQCPETYEPKLPLNRLMVISGGFVADRWFTGYSGSGAPDGWTVAGMTLTALPDGESAYKGPGIHYKGSAMIANTMLYHVALPGLEGQKLKVVYMANRTSGTDDGLRPCLSLDGTTRELISGSPPVVGSTIKVYEMNFTAPADDFYIGLGMGGYDIEGNIYAFDLMYAGNTLIEPVIA